MQNTVLRKLVGAILLTGAILAPVRAVHSQEDQPLAPYLYYYSGILDGFVIERADGTDSRILAQNVIPESHNEIYKPTWSPSGKWLAWRSAEFGRLVAGASPYNEIHLWNTETGELVTVLNWYGTPIAFSPDGRWLAAGNSDLVTIWDVSEY